MTAPGKSWPRELFEVLLVALVFAIFVRTWMVQAFKIPSGSMEDNLLVGDHILVNKFIYGGENAFERALLPARQVERGDIVVFKSPEDPARDYIKRCMGLPGDEIAIRGKALAVDGEPLHESAYASFTDEMTYPDSALVPDYFRIRDNVAAFTVPAGHYFCLGDNRDNSNDSRFWGTVPENHVKGRALIVYWSIAPPRGEPVAGSEESAVGEPSGGARERGPLAAMRWDRTFRLVR